MKRAGRSRARRAAVRRSRDRPPRGGSFSATPSEGSCSRKRPSDPGRPRLCSAREGMAECWPGFHGVVCGREESRIVGRGQADFNVPGSDTIDTSEGAGRQAAPEHRLGICLAFENACGANVQRPTSNAQRRRLQERSEDAGGKAAVFDIGSWMLGVGRWALNRRRLNTYRQSLPLTLRRRSSGKDCRWPHRLETCATPRRTVGQRPCTSQPRASEERAPPWVLFERRTKP